MKIFRFSLICLLIASLNSCSIPTDLFIQNYTNEDILLKIYYNERIEFSENKDLIFLFDSVIVKPKRFLKKDNLQSLKVNKESEYILTIEIPKKSTSRIEATSNYRYMDKIEWIEFNKTKLTIDEFMSLTKRQKSHYVYLIE